MRKRLPPMLMSALFVAGLMMVAVALATPGGQPWLSALGGFIVGGLLTHAVVRSFAE